MMMEKLPKDSGKMKDFYEWRNPGARPEIIKEGIRMRERILEDIKKEMETVEIESRALDEKIAQGSERESSAHVMDEKVALARRRRNAAQSRGQIELEIQVGKEVLEEVLKEIHLKSTPKGPAH